MAKLASGSTINDFPIFHEGNMGTGSGLDADTIRGLDPSYFIRSDTDGGILFPQK